jgi:hypothetical protein
LLLFFGVMFTVIVGSLLPPEAVADEAGSPVLLEDGPLDSLRAAVGLGPTGADKALLRAGGLDCPAELLGAKL